MSWATKIRARFGEMFSGRKFANPGGAVATASREAQGQGPFTGMFTDWNNNPQYVNPYLLEALRRALPPLDGGIDRLVTLDGIIGVEGDDGKAVALLEDFIRSVPVNDAQIGLQSFYAGQGNELYEQGHTVGEFVLAKDGRDIEGMRVADSKGIRYQRGEKGLEVWYMPPGVPPKGRGDGTDDAERILRGSVPFAGVDRNILIANGYQQLDGRTLVYAVHRPEADNPYGTSIMRSIEFVSRILLTVQNATDRTWERFGDPTFNVKYKTNARIDQSELERRKGVLAAALAKALSGKRQGNSVDFVNAVGKEDDIVVEIIGANGTVLEMEQPARHLLEQILAKLGLPSWMFGFSWNTSDRSGDAQVEMILQDAKTRFEQREPALANVCATYLRRRGVTWKRGGWKLVQRLPRLADELKAAQAAFLRGQTALMLSGAGVDPGASPAEPGTDPRGGGQPKLAAILRSGKIPFAKLHAAIEAAPDGAALARELDRLAAEADAA